jgi:hypothetical protein
MSLFINTVCSVFIDNHNNGYTIGGYKLDPEDPNVGSITIAELGVSEPAMCDIKYIIENRTGMPIDSAIAKEWDKLSDIAKTLEDFFTDN